MTTNVSTHFEGYNRKERSPVDNHQNADSTGQRVDGICAEGIRYAVWSSKGPTGVAAYRDRSQGKKEKLRLFKTYAARCASSVKSMYSDMRDCHSASAGLVEALRGDGFEDARVVGCTVFAGNSSGPKLLMGELDIVDKPRHSIVLVDGYIIDATTGQFRVRGIGIPDYLVLPPGIAVPLLELNRQWIENKVGEVYMQSAKNGGTDYTLAYLPTDPDFRHVGHANCMRSPRGSPPSPPDRPDLG